MNPYDEILLPVVETFVSIQGESTHAGRQCFFIRFAACNLRCAYCDTAYAWDAAAAAMRSVSELLALVRAAGQPLIELTGGEPLLQPELPVLAQALLEAGCEVLLETNGSLPVDAMPPGVKKIVDVKLPSSGMDEHNDIDNYSRLGPDDELKFVTGDRTDFDWALAWIKRYRLRELKIPLVFSPVYGAVEPAELARWVIDSGMPELRMQIQMHKVMWHPDRRGV